MRVLCSTRKQSRALICTCNITDGRWVTDDYFEDKALEEITERGLKAGDLVGELPDPNANSQAFNPDSLNAANARNDRSNTGGGASAALGIYRAGGPTTIFGASGWGPFSDGPLNAVRKSQLSRDGVTEENWMWMMATKVLDSGEDWTKWRKEGLKAAGRINGDGAPSGSSLPSNVEASLPEMGNHKEETRMNEGGVPSTKEPQRKRRRLAPSDASEHPLEVYEPHTGGVFCKILCSLSIQPLLMRFRVDRSDSQPTQSRIERLPDSKLKRQVLGGTKTGNGAWALAWVDTVMELPDTALPEEKEREDLLRQVELYAGMDVDLDS